MKLIKIAISGFPPYHDPRKMEYWRRLAERFGLVESEEPDFVLCGGQDFRHLKYGNKPVRILLNSENYVPDFNMFDYAVGSTPMEIGDRYLRVPWFAFYPCFEELAQPLAMSDEELLNRKFCSFVVSNAEFGDPMRKKFFAALSKYKQVDSGGLYCNNIGGPVKDKLEFCRGYKFNIAFENSSYPGYTTEKIMEAYVARSLPIYYGNPTIESDFRLDSMVRVSNEQDIERAVDEIIALDRDDAAYLRKVRSPCLAAGNTGVYLERLTDFLAAIFVRGPVEAVRLSSFGYQAMIRRHLNLIYRMDQRLRDSYLFKFAAFCRSKLAK